MLNVSADIDQHIYIRKWKLISPAALLRSQKSMHHLIYPFFYFTIAILES